MRTNGAEVRIGPESLGYRLTREAMAFGGQTLCATDLAVAAGYANLGDRSLIKPLSGETAQAGIERLHKMLADGVDRMKTNAAPVPLVLVGGGSLLVRDDIPGTSEMIVPEHAGVANAIGASIAQVSGETDRIFAYEATGRDSALETAVQEAQTQAIEMGADADSLETVDIEEVPLAYMPAGRCASASRWRATWLAKTALPPRRRAAEPCASARTISWTSPPAQPFWAPAAAAIPISAGCWP